MRQVACPNCGRVALLENDAPDRCLHCGAMLPAAPGYQPARTMPGAPAPFAGQPPGAASYPPAPPQEPGTPAGAAPFSPPAPPAQSMPPGYPSSYPPAGYGQMPPGYTQPPPGYAPLPPGMPPGAPPAPRMQPPGYPYQYPAPGPAAPYPYPYAGSAPYGYPAALPGGIGPYPGAPPAAPTRKPRRRWPLVTAIVLLVVVLLGGGGTAAVLAIQAGQQSGQSGTPSASPVPTVAISVPGGFTAYQDPAGLYGLAVPSGWQQVSSSSNGATLAEFADATRHASMLVAYEPVPNPPLQERDFNDQLLKQLAASYTGAALAHKAATGNVPLANETWAQESADLTLGAAGSGPTTLHVVVQTASHAAQEGNISVPYLVAMLFVAPADTFSDLDTRYFQPAVQSFNFRP